MWTAADHDGRTVGRGVCGRMHILRTGSGGHGASGGLDLFEHAKPSLDGLIVGIEIGCSGIRVDGVADLIIAALIETSEIEPDFGDVRVDANGARVSVEGIAVLIDVVVEDADAAPEGRIATVPIDRLLVGLVCLLVFLDGHKGTTEEIPALRIGTVCKKETRG